MQDERTDGENASTPLSICYAFTNFRPASMQFLRDIKTFFGIQFKIVPADRADETCPDLVYSCYGVGYVNVNRALA